MLLDEGRRGIPYHLGSSGWTQEPDWRRVLRSNPATDESYSVRLIPSRHVYQRP